MTRRRGGRGGGPAVPVQTARSPIVVAAAVSAEPDPVIPTDRAREARVGQRVWPDITELRVRTKVWLEVDSRFVAGDGGLQLLIGIVDCGSLAGAARRVGWSYRHAWGYLRRAETVLGSSLTVPRPGKGTTRGMTLTESGRGLVETLLEARRRFDDAVGPGGPTPTEIAVQGRPGRRIPDRPVAAS